MPIGSLGETRFLLAFHLFMGLAIVVAVVTAASLRVGNGDLLVATLYAMTFWLGGWAIQSLVIVAFNSVFGLIQARQVIGFAGLVSESRYWTAGRTLARSIAAVIALIFIGGLIAILSGTSLFAVPSIGLTATDSVAATGAWLLCVQALVQMVPIRNTLGRSIMVAVIALVAREKAPQQQCVYARWTLGALSFALIGFAISLISSESIVSLPRWPFLFVVALLMLASSRRWGLQEPFDAFALAEMDPAASDMVESFWQRRRRLIEQRERDQRVLKAREREQAEAADASQVDEILEQLHRAGMQSLNAEQRAVLVRVSSTMRKQKMTDTESDSDK